MIATDLKLIPLAILAKHEGFVRRHLNELSISYAKCLLEEPQLRFPFIYYALLSHWPELLNGEAGAEELIYNQLYWFLRLSKQYQVDHDFDAGVEQQAFQLMESAETELGAATVLELDQKVTAEIQSNEREIAVAFSEFSIRKVKQQFGIKTDEQGDFFAHVVPIPVSTCLQESLRRSLPMALNNDTEKARSEMIVTPILLEVREHLAGSVSIYCGMDWEVDAAQGLRGKCDFLMGLSPESLTIESPILTVVEVKNDDTTGGIAQCIAEMVAAQLFNRKNQVAILTIFGIVTTGNTWKFLRLVNDTVYLDATHYYLNEVERIVGIIVSMFTSSGVATKT